MSLFYIYIYIYRERERERERESVCSAVWFSYYKTANCTVSCGVVRCTVTCSVMWLCHFTGDFSAIFAIWWTPLLVTNPYACGSVLGVINVMARIKETMLKVKTWSRTMQTLVNYHYVRIIIRWKLHSYT